MDVFYEESSTVKDFEKETKKFKILNIVSKVFLVLWVLSLIMAYAIIDIRVIIPWLFICAWLIFVWVVLCRWRNRYNVSYDYCFVTGELRITKVLNVTKRKFLVCLHSEEIIQLGDVDSESFTELQNLPDVKTIVYTSNTQPSAEKFLMYIYTINDGKKSLYVLECREELLMHVLRFAKRTALAKDYVMQEKKNKV